MDAAQYKQNHCDVLYERCPCFKNKKKIQFKRQKHARNFTNVI